MALGLDNFLYEVKIDGKTANFHFWDPEDSTNTADVSVSDKEVPDANAEARETAEYAFSLVSKQLNDKRIERRKAADTARLSEQQDADKAAKAATAQHLSEASDNKTAPLGTEKREDGTVQNVYSSTITTKDDKKK